MDITNDLESIIKYEKTTNVLERIISGKFNEQIIVRKHFNYSEKIQIGNFLNNYYNQEKNSEFAFKLIDRFLYQKLTLPIIKNNNSDGIEFGLIETREQNENEINQELINFYPDDKNFIKKLKFEFDTKNTIGKSYILSILFFYIYYKKYKISLFPYKIAITGDYDGNEIKDVNDIEKKLELKNFDYFVTGNNIEKKDEKILIVKTLKDLEKFAEKVYNDLVLLLKSFSPIYKKIIPIEILKYVENLKIENIDIEIFYYAYILLFKNLIQIDPDVFENKQRIKNFYQKIIAKFEEDYYYNQKKSNKKYEIGIYTVGETSPPINFSIRLFRPNKIFFLASEKTKNVAEDLIEVLKKELKFEFESKILIINENNYFDMKENFNKIFEDISKITHSEKVYLDITGGKKTMAFAGINESKQFNFDVYYGDVAFINRMPESFKLNFIKIR